MLLLNFLLVGVLSALGWLLWCFIVRKQRPYYKKMLRFYFLFGLSMSLELMDFPPIFWMFDAHALWHLATVPVSLIFYRYVVTHEDSTKYLFITLFFFFFLVS